MYMILTLLWVNYAADKGKSTKATERTRDKQKEQQNWKHL
jgi:hypothetical protein